MMLRAVILTIVGGIFATDARGGDQFPYTGYINASDVYLRSGPGENYYPVSKLDRGQAVEIYRHDPGGWYAIRPTEKCFSWVSGDCIEPGEGNLAVVTKLRVVSRVGSQFSDVRDVIQIRLDQGEVVEVIEAKRFNSGPAAQTWYKIVPPAGEFRWVSGKFVDREPAETKPREANPDNNLLISRHSHRDDADQEANDDADEEELRDDDHPVRQAGHRESGRGEGAKHARYDRDEEADDDRDPLQASDDDAGSDDRWTRRGGVPIERSQNRKRANRADEEVELDDADLSIKDVAADLDLELSAMVAEEPTAWEFSALKRRAESALTRAETALDRGRIRRVLHKIENFADLQRRYATVMNVRSETDRANDKLARLDRSARSSLTSYRNGPRYDGVGRLTQVLSRDPGSPQFALLNESGQVVYYVSPSPGVNLRRYLNQDVGIHGTLGYLPEQRAQHVTAQRIVNIDGRTLR